MKTKKFAALMATLLMGTAAMGAFSGCGGEEMIDSNYDETKASISIGTYAGGVGRAWLDDAARRFEKLHENSTFGGKTGVTVSVDAHKVTYGGANLETGALTKDIYFTEGVNYYKFITANKAADISDVVKNSAGYGETGTIEAKIDQGMKEYLTANTDGKYYMLPFYTGFYGFTYDVDLFEEESFYFDDQGGFIGLSKEDKGNAEARKAFEAAKSNGPDGKENTYDDGLPTTYEQMIELCDAIKDKGFIPFCYAGSTEYVDKAFRSYISDYEGYDAMRLNYTLNGKANLVTEIVNGVAKTEEVDVTPADAYKLQKQAGKYYALMMEEKLFGEFDYIGGEQNTMGHTEAQRKFIYSKYEADQSNRYAMLAEGVWWENEAEETFKEIEVQRKESKHDRRFAFMPVPKASPDRVGEQTMLSLNSSYGFINKDSANLELAKEFMRFLHTDAEMSKFSAKTSIPRALNYTVSAEDRATATTFGQSLIDMRSNAKVVYPYSSTSLVLNNTAAFDEVKWFSTILLGKEEVNAPIKIFQAGKADAETYFNSLYTYQESKWSTLKK